MRRSQDDPLSKTLPRSARFDDARGRCWPCSLLALAAPAAASAAQPRLAALPSPLAALSATPPLGTGASAAAEGVRHHIDSTTRVRVAVDARGTPFAVTATQRLVVSQPGDYYFTIGAPLTDVAPAYGSQSTPGLRTATIIWAGFNPGKRVLAARATLDPAAVAGSLPLRVSIGGGKVRLANATGITTTAFAADALKPQLEMFLAGLRPATRTGSRSDRRWRTRDVAARADDGAGDRTAARDRDDRVAARRHRARPRLR